jgi:two-component system, LytTR family, sensor kinase
VLGHYLDIQQIRFQDRLHVSVNVDPEATRALVPTLILQPLVENAVRHGVAQRPGQGRIVIGARKTEAGLELTVLDCAEPAEASVPPAGHESGRSRGVGLENTRRRLAQLYGAAAALRLDPLPRGNGTLVTVSLPLAHA